MDATATQRTIPVFIVVGLLGLVVCGLGFYEHRGFYHDDAFIPLRCCRHLLQGKTWSGTPVSTSKAIAPSCTPCSSPPWSNPGN